MAVLAIALPVGLAASRMLNADPDIIASPAPVPSQTPTGAAQPDLLVAESFLVEQANGEVTFCVGILYQTLPPACSGVTVEGDFSWDSVEHEEAGGIRFTDVPYRLVGLLDPVSTGGVFTITQAPEPAGAPSAGESRDTADLCTDPLRDSDPTKVGPSDMNALVAATEALPVVSFWLSDGTTGVNVLVQGDSEAAYSQLRTVWSGPLCVGSSDRATQAQREAARDRVVAALPADQFLTASVDSGDFHDPTLAVQVLRLSPELEAQINQAAGPDVKVVIEVMFTPYVP